MNEHTTMKMSVLGLGLALSISWALGILLLGLMATFGDWGTSLVNAFGSLYIGYKATFIGSIIGTIWALVDGFICGVLIAFFYNLFSRK